LLERLLLAFALVISRFLTSPTLDHYDDNLLSFVACRPRRARIGLRFLRLRRKGRARRERSGRAVAI